MNPSSLKAGRPARNLSVLLGFLTTGLSATAAPQTPFRPWPADQPNASSLLIYSEPYPGYSLVDGRELVATWIRRVATSLESVSFAEVTSQQITQATHLILFCPGPIDRLPEPVASVLDQTNRSLLWIGYGAEKAADHDVYAGHFAPREEGPPGTVRAVQYRNRTWQVPATMWQPFQLTHPETTEPLITLPDREGALAWRDGRATFFSALPGLGMTGWLFSDLLLDFYGATNVAPSHLLLRLVDYHPLSNHDAFLRMVDFVHSRGIPFAIGATPVAVDPESGREMTLGDRPEFVRALKYAQQRGGRLVLRGCCRPADGGSEFWDHTLDRPKREADHVSACLKECLEAMRRHDLFPVAWETPGEAASAEVYAELARHFSTALEGVQVSDATSRIRQTVSGLTLDRYGRLLIPCQGAFVPAHSNKPVEALYPWMQDLLAMRGTIVDASFHVYLALPRLMDWVDYLQSLEAPFVDLVDLDNRVEWPGGLILTGQASSATKLGDGPVRWRAFDRNGRLAGESTLEFIFSGDRRLERRGLGLVELFESMDGDHENR